MNNTDDNSPLNRHADTEDLIAAAQRHFASDFPNPQRAGCPASGKLQAIVLAERLPDDALQQHLFGCSECFNEYRVAVLEQRQTNATKIGWREKLAVWLWEWRTPLLTGLGALLLLAIGFSLWQNRRPAKHSTTEIASSGSPTPSPMRSEETAALPETSSTPEADRLLAVRLDLNDVYSLGEQNRGGANDAASKPIRLQAAHLSLTLGMRDDSPAGDYRIQVLDSRGQLVTKTAQARVRYREGKPLLFNLDLRGARKALATLRIERVNQQDIPPEDYQAEIRPRH